MRVKTRKIVKGAAVLLIGAPLVLFVSAAAYICSLERSSGAIVSSNEEREYLLHVPSSYDSAVSTPLVISMHGAAGWPAQQMETSRFNRVADEHGFIVVYPAGRRFPLGPRLWSAAQGAGLAEDVTFISDLIDELEVAYNIDPSRVYVNGLSLGGGMTFALSCTLTDRIAAVGTVAAAQTLPFRWCPDPGPMPVIAFHGTADPMVPYLGSPPGDWFLPGIPSVETWMTSWAQRNRCAKDPVASNVTRDVTRIEYTDCADDAAVVLYAVRGGGHTWPGGKPLREWIAGPTSDSIDASSLMWSFFREHPLSGKQERHSLRVRRPRSAGPP
jgi:polyhydroxybutyrate depolymerase